MAEQQIRFEDGAAYERMMGTWSRLAGETFIDWLKPQPGLRWIDIGCGNGAFSQLICDRCAPAEVQGIDPSEAQLAFAHARPAARLAKFQRGDAMTLPFPDDSFEAAAMALVIFFVPDPAKGVAEMARVVAPGGSVAAYAWGLEGGGLPGAPIIAELGAMGVAALRPPSPQASRLDVMQGLWGEMGLEAVETLEMTVERTFADFEKFWTINLLAPSVGPSVASLGARDASTLKSRVRQRVMPDSAERITYAARANAVKGRVPR